MKRKPINVEEIQSIFRLNNERLERINSRYTDCRYTVVANKKNSVEGYCQVHFNSRNVYYHTIIWILSTGKDIPEGYDIDHINGNEIDNRMENLRLVTNRGNQQNQKVHRGGQLCGSGFYKRTGKYRTNIQISGKRIHLGYYNTEQEAHRSYRIACRHINDYVDNASFRKLVNKEMKPPDKKN